MGLMFAAQIWLYLGEEGAAGGQDEPRDRSSRGICGLFLLITLGMGIAPGLKHTNSVAGFVAADRGMSFIVLYFVLGASIFSSFAFLGAPGWAFSRGASAFYILAYGIVGMVPFYFMGPRARRLGERYGFVTQAELLAWRYESKPMSVLLVGAQRGGLRPLPGSADEGRRPHPQHHLGRPGHAKRSAPASPTASSPFTWPA